MGRTKTKPFLKRKKVPKLYFHFWPPNRCPPFFFLIHSWWCENITASPCACIRIKLVCLLIFEMFPLTSVLTVHTYYNCLVFYSWDVPCSCYFMFYRKFVLWLFDIVLFMLNEFSFEMFTLIATWLLSESCKNTLHYLMKRYTWFPAFLSSHDCPHAGPGR